jgi:hypothetical protein
MLELVERHGDVRQNAISDCFPLQYRLKSLYTDRFGGVTILRNVRKLNDRPITLVILPPAQAGPDLGNTIRFMSIDEPDLLSTLHRYRVVRYDVSLVPRRLKEIEDELLTQHDIDVTSLYRNERRDALHEVESELPDCWDELRSVEKITRHGRAPSRPFLAKLSTTTRIKLTRANLKFKEAARVLAELDESDLDRLLRFRPSRYVALLSQANPAQRARFEARLASGRQASNKE